MQKGQFITFEGTEGAGKSTQIPLLKAWLLENNIDVITTREPGGTVLSEKIRSLLLNDKMPDETELLLMFAARKSHLDEVIIPALNSGKWVLCDRFTEATYAYQAAGRKIDQKRIEYLEEWLQEGVYPTKTFWFDIPIEEGLKRAKKRGELDRFEKETLDFFIKVRSGYNSLYETRRSYMVKIDAMQSIESITDALKAELEPFLRPEGFL